MCLSDGNLVNELITRNNKQYSLDGKVCPTFQNQGTAKVSVNGLLLNPGESYVANLPMLKLKNSIQISFEEDTTKTRILYVGYGTLV